MFALFRACRQTLIIQEAVFGGGVLSGGNGGLSPGMQIKTLATYIQTAQILHIARLLLLQIIVGRGGMVRRGARAVAGGARQDDAAPAGGAGGGGACARRGAGGGRAAAADGGRGRGAPRRAGGAEGRGGVGRRVPPRVRGVGVRRRALLPLDRRLPPLGAHQG